MSKLNVYHHELRHNEYYEFYLKYEADKVIAELEDKLQAANEQVENLINSASSIMLFQDRVNDNKCDELRHSNYKRCVAMAERYEVEHKLARYLAYNSNKEIKAYKRWQKWLELAEKFKHNNSTAQ